MGGGALKVGDWRVGVWRGWPGGRCGSIVGEGRREGVEHGWTKERLIEDRGRGGEGTALEEEVDSCRSIRFQPPRPVSAYNKKIKKGFKGKVTACLST